jgi:TRAP-type C4-dicarboxylate transport system substrate-binding protein
VIEALGASPAAMPVPELPQALSKKVVDGALIPWEIIPPLKIQEQTRSQIEGAGRTRLGTSVFQVAMNKDRWDSLPPDIQQAFRDASGAEWVATVGDIWSATDQVGIKVATDAGNEHVVLSEEETDAFRQALEPVVGRWVEEVGSKGIVGDALVAKAREAVKKHSN